MLVLASVVAAQDLQIRVQILSPQVQSTNKRAFDVLQQAITDFLNNKKWSENNTAPEERIEGSLVITVKDWDGSSRYEAEAQLISTRPVFHTAYNSTVLSLTDRHFDFNYTEGEPLDFSNQQYTNNLTSLLAYYAYIIVGIDADTFSPNGGTPYFTSAQQVVNNAQSTNFTGWKSIEGMDNRFWLVSNLLDKNFQPLRNFSYKYHLQVLDKMADRPNPARSTLLNILPTLTQIDRMTPGAVYNQVFFTAKSDELVGLLSGLPKTDRVKAIQVLSEADPANINKYDTLKSL